MKRDVDGYEGEGVTGFLRGRSGPDNQHGDSGSAARFFYTAKASKSEKEDGLQEFDKATRGNTHPTVKPIALMRYLVKMITPKGGIVLDPFGGSGTTAHAAIEEGRRYISFDLRQNQCELTRRRLSQITPVLFAS